MSCLFQGVINPKYKLSSTRLRFLCTCPSKTLQPVVLRSPNVEIRPQSALLGPYSVRTSPKMVKSGGKKICPDEKSPHFFKIMHSDMPTQYLRIPPAFLKHISKEKSERAILEGPSGSHWHVKLCKTTDDAVLQDGWQDFLRDHSLWDNEFLVFRYEGNMHFNVQIFDKSGCERQDVFTIKTHQGSDLSNGGKKRGRPSKKFFSSSGRKRGRPPKQFTGSAELSWSKACNKEPGNPKRLC